MAQKKLFVRHNPSTPNVDLRTQELQAAKEILAEIFGVRISGVEEMLQNRYDEISYTNPRKPSNAPRVHARIGIYRLRASFFSCSNA